MSDHGPRWLGWLARLVPPGRRSEWRREWEAELAAAPASTLRLLTWAVEDALREAWRGGARQGLGSDVRVAARVLWRAPGYAVAVSLTLALGISATTVVYSVVDAWILRPLPLPEADRVVAVLRSFQGSLLATSAPNYLDWKASSRSFRHLGAIRMSSGTLTGRGPPERLRVASVTPDLFRAVGVEAPLGRTFTEGDAARGESVVLSHDLWIRTLGGDPDVLGRTVRLDGRPRIVVGILPDGFELPPFSADVWRTLTFGPEARAARSTNVVFAVGRLADGVSLDEARSEMAGVAERLAEAYPEANRETGIALRPLRELAVGGSAGGLRLLLAAAGSLLVLACVNVAGLVLGRGLARRREWAVRVSLGASGARVAAALLTETLLLALVGGAVGVVLARVALSPVLAFVPSSLAALGAPSIDGRVLSLAVAATTLAGLGAGLVPAVRAGRRASRRPTVGVARDLRAPRATARGGLALVSAQFAVATTLVVAAALSARSLAALYDVDVGLAPHGVTSFVVSLPEERYPTPEEVGSAIDGVVGRLARRSDVLAVAAVSDLPLTGARLSSGLRVQGGPEQMANDGPSAAIKVITPGYFEALGIPVLRGRAFAPSDDGSAEAVVVVNRVAARQLWPGEDAVGKWVSYTDVDGVPLRRRVVGVVGDVRSAGPARGAEAEVYQPHRQTTTVWGWTGGAMTLVVRTRSGGLLPLTAAREAVAAVDPGLPVLGHRSMDEVLDASLGTPRFHGALLSAFAILALSLAGVGVFAVTAFQVRRRRGEVGVRMALGAGGASVVRAMLGPPLRATLVGGGLGLGVAAASARALAGLAQGVGVADPVTWVAAVGFMSVAALVGAGVPALAAARVDPARTLGAE